MPVAIIVLLIVLFAISIRNVLSIRLPIWLITSVGAIFVIVSGQISLEGALYAIEPDVMLYLFGVFFISFAAESCGFLEHFTDKVYAKAVNGNHALFITVFVLGLSAAFLMNDTIAIVGTLIIIQLCKYNKNLIKPLLLALAYSITIGSAMSPIGNPQNLLIAVKGNFETPFLEFLIPLFIPTILNLFIVYTLLFITYKNILKEKIAKPTPEPLSDTLTASLVKICFLIMVALLVLKGITDTMQLSYRLKFSYIALISALPLLISNKRLSYFKKLDWGTLLFFASTFILVRSVWDSGFLQDNLSNTTISITSLSSIMIISVILSQFISNVPLVALYLPLLIHHSLSTSHLLALGVSSTIAGNISIIGAASNIIIIHNAEKRQAEPFGFLEFMKLGVPLVIVNLLVYKWFLKI